MGDRTISEFFCSCDQHYLANNLSGIDSYITDFEGLADHARKHVCKMRRVHDFTKDEARRLFDRCENLEGVENLDAAAPAMSDVFGPEWWYAMPNKANPDYEYLCRIIRCVQEGLRQVESTDPDDAPPVPPGRSEGRCAC